MLGSLPASRLRRGRFLPAGLAPLARFSNALPGYNGRAMTEVSLLAALAAGVISFISPCVLPIVPGYISFISGASLSELKNPVELDPERRRDLFRKVAANSLFFVLGFSLVFVAMGAS